MRNRANEGPNSNASGPAGSTNSRTEQPDRSTALVLGHNYHQLYRAAIQENWEDTAEVFGKCHQHASEAKKWALHFAMRTGNANSYLKNLLQHMKIDDLKSVENGKTALSIAAAVGNVDVVKLLVEKDPNLPYDEWTTVENWPLNVAAKYGHKEMVLYLLDVTTNFEGSNGEDPCGGESAHLLLQNLINSGLYGAALQVVERYSNNNRSTSRRQMCSPLTELANQPFAFRSTCSLSYFQQLLYFVTSEKLEDHIDNFQIYMENLFSPTRTQRVYRTCSSMNDIWNQDIQVFLCNTETTYSSMNYWWYQNMAMLQNAVEPAWDAMEKLVRWVIKEVEEIKLMNDQSSELVKSLCELLKGENENESEANFKKPFLLASEHGIMEIVQQILVVFPSAIDFTEGENNILVLAVKNRNESILGLREHTNKFKEMAENFENEDGDNILHIAGKLLAPKEELSSMVSPAMQLRSELMWLKKVEDLVPTYLAKVNNKNETPKMIFEEQHKELLHEGKKWMKKIAKLCKIVSLLITVIVLSSVIILSRFNIIYGYYSNILPVTEDGFIVVVVLDWISIDCSCYAFLMFEEILNSDYSYYDFHPNLPLFLLFGLGALCLSIFFMIIACVATLYIVVGNAYKILVVLILVGIFSCLPAIIGVFLYCSFSRLDVFSKLHHLL